MLKRYLVDEQKRKFEVHMAFTKKTAAIAMMN